jgi:hypothetical protein
MECFREKLDKGNGSIVHLLCLESGIFIFTVNNDLKQTAKVESSFGEESTSTGNGHRIALNIYLPPDYDAQLVPFLPVQVSVG